MKINFNLWVILKVVLVGSALVAGSIAPVTEGHVSLIGYASAFLIPLAIVYFWLKDVLACKQNKFNLNNIITSAFYPMKKYPFNYWLICSIMLAAFGISYMIKSFIKMGDLGLYSISLPIGLGIFAACSILRFSEGKFKNR